MINRFIIVFLVLASACDVLAGAASGDSRPGLFVAVGYGGRRMSSHDGVAWENDQQWSDVAADNDDVLFNVAFGKGKFIAVGGASKGHILMTRDGKEWKEVFAPKSRVATVAFGNDRFVAGHSDKFLFSTDGETWTPGEKIKFQGGIHFRKSAFGNGVFVIIGDCDPNWKNRVSCRATTTDGATVVSFDSDTPAARSIAFGAGRFVVVGPDGLRESSSDGKTWEHQVKEPGEDVSSVVWTGKEFVTAGGKSSYTSPDGITWTKAAKRVPCSVLYAANDLIIGSSWGGNIFSCVNGAEWKKGSIKEKMPSIEAVTFGVPEP